MDQYIVSARKYRPSTFHSVVGQSALTSTLKGAIQNGQLAHAYLFCGPRGVGKTTCARIFAKAINCMNLQSDGEPCNECESCRAFNENGSFNIHELDAASNNSVDDIRSIVDQVRIPPSMGKYSVYIVDEVHMLSKAAFNAFLKTLEEPPAHVKFILATTERHKILPTILSRCQVYTFNRIKVSDTVKYLQYVCSQEGITAESAALTVVAQKADGAMRDALSIFDQLVSFCGNNITYSQAVEHLNVLDYEYYFKLVDCFLGYKVKDSLLLFDEILNKGFDAQYFVTGLASHFRDLLVSKDAQTSKLLDVSEEVEARYKEQNVKCPNAFIYKAIEIANDCDYEYRLSRNKRLLVELLLIKLCGLMQPNADSKKASPKLPKIAVATVSDVKQEATSSENDKIGEANGAYVAPVAPVAPASQIVAPKVGVRTRYSVLGKTSDVKTTSEPIVEKVEELKPVEVVEERFENRPLDDALLQKAWVDYATNLDKQAHVTNMMKNFSPRIKPESEIEVILVNSMQQEELMEHRRSIENYLVKELKNTNIHLSILMDDGSHYIDTAFTPDEKLNKMLDKNEHFRYLKQALGLDLYGG